jgi:amino acid transporter
MRSALLYGGIASFVLVAGLLLATPANPKGYAAATSFAGGIPLILSQLPQWLQDFFLIMVIIAFFSCGTAVQGAGARLAFSYARDGAVPGSAWVRKISPRFHTPSNALIVGALVPVLFTLLVNFNPSKDVHILWFTFPAGINALTALVSFGVSGIYLSFLLTVIGSMIARTRGWVPEGAFRLGRWAWPVSIVAASYLALMLINVLVPTGLDSPRGALFNLDWITLVVVLGILVVGAVYFFIARPDRHLAGHLSDQLEATGAERHND